MRRCDQVAFLGAGLALLVAGCEWPFPEMPPIDSDGDGWTVEEGDCNDVDREAHPDADECALLLEEPTDHDCDGVKDGGSLPWSDDFEDGVIEGWVQGAASLANLDEHDGVLEQSAPHNFAIVRSRNAQCWQDLDLVTRMLPGLSGEFQCSFRLRVGPDVDAKREYTFCLHHHSENADGVNDDWDGWTLPHIDRHDGDGAPVETLVGEAGEQGLPFNPDLYLPESDVYVVHVAVREIEGGTELLCEYDLEDGSGYRPCFGDDPVAYVDDAETRPMFGGVGLGCTDNTFSFVNMGIEDPLTYEGQLGVAIDYAEISEATGS